MRRQYKGRSDALVHSSEGEQGFWPSYADMMSAVALILFFLMLLSYIQNLITGNDLQNTQELLADTRIALTETEETLALTRQQVEDAENELSPSVFRQLVDALKGSFDYVIIDSPAGIGSGFVTAAAPANRALIVTNAEPTSVRGAVKVRKRLEALGINDARLVINRFDKRVFRKLGFYPDLDAVIDAAQTQLISLVPFDINISVVMQKGAAGIESGASFTPFERLARRVEGTPCPLVLKGML